MKLSRYLFLTGVLGTVVLALAGCGGGNDNDVPNPNPSQQLNTFNGYSARVVTSPDKRYEAATFAGAQADAPTRYITNRLVGSSTDTVLFNAEQYTAGEVLGSDIQLLWSPDSSKLYYITSVKQAGQADWRTWITQVTWRPGDQENGQLLYTETRLYDNRLQSMQRGSGDNVLLYLTGMTEDGTRLFYTREETSPEGVTRTNYAYEIAEQRATIAPP